MSMHKIVIEKHIIFLDADVHTYLHTHIYMHRHVHTLYNNIHTLYTHIHIQVYVDFIYISKVTLKIWGEMVDKICVIHSTGLPQAQGKHHHHPGQVSCATICYNI